MFHKIKSVSPLPDFRLSVQFSEGVDVGGYGIVWNDALDLSCDELWEHGVRVCTAFDGLMAFSDATELWGLNESTLRKAIAYGKLVNGVDVCKFGKQWVVSMDAMKREYGDPA